MDIEVKEDYPIKNLTSFKIGGAAQRLYFPKNQQEFVYLLKTLRNPMIFGQWSNVLISSAGIKGDVISTVKLDKIEIKGTKIFTESGVKGPSLAQKAAEASLGGFEFMIGFPGSVGGNICMNASAHSQAISDFLVNVCVFDLSKKEIKVLEKKDLEFDYRTSAIQKKPYIVLSAEFELKKSNKVDIDALLKRNLEFRKTHQPTLALPNAGSIFKNPPNDSAGRLLDKAGVKGLEVNGAKVWDNHANFIVNDGSATSTDVLELMLKMYEEVKNKYTLELKPEIRYFGEKSKREAEICNILYRQK